MPFPNHLRQIFRFGEAMTTQFYLTELAEVDARMTNRKRYIVWPIESGSHNGIINIMKSVASGDDLQELIDKFGVELNQIFKAGKFRAL